MVSNMNAKKGEIREKGVISILEEDGGCGF
jgi:hypothetical protein